MAEIKTASQIWETALGELQVQVNRSNYRTWLAKTCGLELKDGQLVIGVPSTFVAEYLDKNQRFLIEKVVTGIIKEDIRVTFQVNVPSPAPLPGRNGHDKVSPVQQGTLPLFNPRYTFDSFIVGHSNQLAYNAAMGILQNPGSSYNPLFIYGGSGLGKTHLLQAIGQDALRKNMKVIYVRAEEYTNQLINAIKQRKTDEFRNRYRSADMLLVDDVQFFGGKTQTEENFFHTFEELHNASHQIAITSDRPPKSLPFLQKKLRSRFEGGLITDIQAPDFDTRLQFLEAKADEKEAEITPDVLEMIALQINENIRSLEGSLNRVVAYAKLVRSMLTPELASQALKDIADTEPQKTQVSAKLITEAVVNSFQVTPADLRGRKRDELTAMARQVAMYLIRQETDCSLAEIGKELGGRTPATVSHAYQKIAGDMTNNPSLRRKVFDIQQDLSRISHNCHQQ